MKVHFPRLLSLTALSSSFFAFRPMVLFAAPLCAQQPRTTRRSLPSQPQAAAPKLEIATFRLCFSTDSYKLWQCAQYRSVDDNGTAMRLHRRSNYQLAVPTKEFNSIIKFLETERPKPLTSSPCCLRLWPARTGVRTPL